MIFRIKTIVWLLFTITVIKPTGGWPQVNNGDKMKEFVAIFASLARFLPKVSMMMPEQALAVPVKVPDDEDVDGQYDT